MKVAFIFLAFCAAVSHSRVTFTHSVILDEYDFTGQNSVMITGLCSDTCHIYASITPESRNLATNLLIQTAKGFTTLASVADLRNNTTNQKQPLEVLNTASLSIVNANSGNAAGPLVLYVVNKAATYFGNTEVYEAEGLDRAPNMVQSITILSARPFTLTEANYAPMGVLARLTGFDALAYNSDPCPNLYYLLRAPFPGFSMTINAPIVSLLYDVQQFHFPAGELKATIGISSTHVMESTGFFNSPGYHGCTGKAAYRSSLYDMNSPVLEKLVDPDAQQVSYNIVTNSDADHAVVVLNEDGNEVERFYNTGDVGQTRQIVDKTVHFSWKPTTDTYFLVRYNATA